MKHLFFPGFVQLRLKGLQIEKMLNAIHKNSLFLYDLQREKDRTLLCRCRKKDLPVLFEYCKRFSCQAETMNPSSFLEVWIKYLFRPHVCIFLLFGFLLASLSMQYIWQIEIIDAYAFEGEIRSFLRENDIRPGLLKKDVSPHELAEKLMWRFPQAAWVRSEYQGVRLCITFVEGTPPPVSNQKSQKGNVVASQDGIVLSVLTLSGTPRVSPGDLVHKGQILIEGTERGKGDTFKKVKAQGTVRAKVWEEAVITLPAYEILSKETGRTLCRRGICTPFFSVFSSSPPSFKTMDTEISYDSIGGSFFPVFLRREHHKEAELDRKSFSHEEIENEIYLASKKVFAGFLREGDFFIDKWTDYSMIEEEKWAASCVMEISRDIGRFQPSDPSFSPFSP